METRQPLDKEDKEMFAPRTEPLRGPQSVLPMEVTGQAEGASRLENRAVKETQDTIMDFEYASAAASNVITTGGGEEGRKETRDMADLDVVVGVGDGSSSNMAKKRKIVDDNPWGSDLKLVNPVIEYSVNVPLPWSRTLCGSFNVGEDKQELDFSLFNEQIRHLWKSNGIEVENIIKKKKESFYYIFIFKTDQGMLDALEKGPTWTVGDVEIVLKSWGPGHFLESNKKDRRRQPTWIQIYNMPHGLWKTDVVLTMSSVLGIPMGLDQHTRSICQKGGEYEHATVKVDLDSRVKVDLDTRPKDDDQLVDDVISVSFPNSDGDGDGYLLSHLRFDYEYMCSYCKVNSHSNVTCNRRRALQANKHTEIPLKKEQDKGIYEAQDPAIKVVDDDHKTQDTTVKVAVARDDDLFKQIGKDIYFDLVDHSKVWSFRVEKKMSFTSVKEEVARELGVPVECQRFWTWAKRQNHTYRPYRPLTCLEETQSVEQLRVVYKKFNNAEAELNLFLETVIDPDSRPLRLPRINGEDILVFFKLYDPEKSELRYVGRLFVKSCEKPTEIIAKLNEKAGFSPDEEIELFEEIKFERYHELEFDPCVMCESLNKRTSFGSSQIKDGDIICFQKLYGEKYQYPDIPSFLEYVNYRQVVHFRSKDKPQEEAFSLELSKLHTYDDVADGVAKKLGLGDSSKIRFTPHNFNLKHPESGFPIKYRVKGHLLQMLGSCNQGYDILYYELLDMSLPELQRMKTLKVAFYHATTTKEEPVIHNIRLPKQSNVGDVLTELSREVNAAHPDAELRLLQLYNHKISKVFKPREIIWNIDDEHRTLRAEKIPEEEKDMGCRDRRIHVCHFTKEAQQNQIVHIYQQQQVKNFGEPFFMVIRKDETLAAVKVRIQGKLQVPDDEFSKWKFAYITRTSLEYLEDTQILSEYFRRTSRDNLEAYLGLEHSDEQTIT